MKDYELLQAIGGIDGRFVENAAISRSKIRIWRIAAPAAACAVILAGVLIAFPKKAASPVTVPVPNPNGTIERTEMPETFPELHILRPGDPGYIEPEPTPDIIQEPANGPFSGDSVNGFLPMQPNGSQTVPDISDVKPMLQGYGMAGAVPEYAAQNGDIGFSEALSAAMKRYGDDVKYRVLIELYSDGVQIPGGGERFRGEADRLSSLGYTVAMEGITETREDGGYVTAKTTWCFTLHATLAQLEELTASEDLGYYVMLYNEYFGIDGEDLGTQIFNGNEQAKN